jgi:broad specificity phosphatase PhoE
MKLIVVRHAITASNEQGLISGRFDNSLSESGQKEVSELVPKLHSYKFDLIYSSPLKRTLETATPIAKDHGLEIKTDPRIIEVNMGIFTRKPYASTVPAFGKISSQLLDTYVYDLRAYGGETSEEVQQRVSSFIDSLKKRSDNSVLVVTHGGIIRWFYYLCNGEKVGRFPNVSIHIFDI